MWRDEAWVLDMLAAARRAKEHVAGLSEEELLASGLHQDAIVRQLEVLGEAASNVSKAFRDEHTAIPWPQIVGMRNRLIHEYFRVDLVVVWSVVKDELPPLIVQLESIVPPPEET